MIERRRCKGVSLTSSENIEIRDLYIIFKMVTLFAVLFGVFLLLIRYLSMGYMPSIGSDEWVSVLVAVTGSGLVYLMVFFVLFYLPGLILFSGSYGDDETREILSHQIFQRGEFKFQEFDRWYSLLAVAVAVVILIVSKTNTSTMVVQSGFIIALILAYPCMRPRLLKVHRPIKVAFLFGAFAVCFAFSSGILFLVLIALAIENQASPADVIIPSLFFIIIHWLGNRQMVLKGFMQFAGAKNKVFNYFITVLMYFLLIISLLFFFSLGASSSSISLLFRKLQLGDYQAVPRILDYEYLHRMEFCANKYKLCCVHSSLGSEYYFSCGASGNQRYWAVPKDKITFEAIRSPSLAPCEEKDNR
ncbi:hypothetical protein LGV61_12540 [Desulfurispirillum indicum]|uniref:hypothetical protein n=1 Tax=Desulfurispirillum indicum TaxID=936456 RepID=UPI001CF993DE|nr:hypothetical protein [Desulfurispirillum indicum]UCZ56540.1 hypothetical protein LGV61_12540 [Desulfurispirillum indicum]